MPRGFNDYDSARIQGRLWTPAVLRPAGWWDAADQSTITISTGVSEWRDKSGNGRNATQATSSSQPVYSSFGAQGRPSLQFDGNDDTLTLSSPGSTKQSIAVAIIPTAASGGSGSYRGITATDGGPNNNVGSMMLAGVGGPWGTYSSSNVPSTATLAANTPYILLMAGTATGTFFTSGSSSGTYSVSEGQVPSHIGGLAGPPSFQGFTGHIMEVLWIPQDLPIPLRTAIEGYLSHKWAIPLAADHPFVNRPPLIGD
jgi:hypothetical protein